MSIPFGHHQLHNRYRFTGSLTLESPLRVSSGRASDETDAPLMRNRAGVPYIPGSSLRGAIRSTVERILNGIGSVSGLKSCTLFSSDDCNNKTRQFQQSGEKKDEELASFADKELCDVCKLFGATVCASRVVIEDAYPKSPTTLGDKILVRDGVGIDRDTGTAREGAKFDYEVMEAGPTFIFHMQVENVTKKDRLLINLILGLLRVGLHVGGKQAAGLGKIKLDGKLAVNGFEGPEKMWEAVKVGKDPHQPLAWKEGA